MKYFNRKKILNIFILLTIIAVFLIGVFKDPKSTENPFLNFDPLPDAFEYALVASNIYNGIGPYITFNYNNIPSRYPIGYPLLIIPFFIILGNDISVSYYASLTFGLLSIIFVYLIVQRLFQNDTISFLTTIFLALNPLIITFSGLTTSEISTVFFGLLSIYLAIVIQKTSKSHLFFLFGLSIGFSIVIRLTNLLFVIPILIYILESKKLKLFNSGFFLFIIGIVGCLLILIGYNYLYLGSPLKSGYDIYTPVTLFSFSFLSGNAPEYFRSLFLSIGGKSIWLNGPFYSFVIPIFFVIGIVFLLKEKQKGLLLFGAGLIIIYFIFFSFYKYYDIRFFLPIFIIIFTSAAIGVTKISLLFKWKARFMFILFVLMAYLTGVPDIKSSPLNYITQNIIRKDLPANYVNVKEINEYIEKINTDAHPYFIASSLNLAYHSYFSNGKYSVIPLDANQEYSRVPQFSNIFSKYCIDSLLQKGSMVFVSDFPSGEGFTESGINQLKIKYVLEPVHTYLYQNCKLYRLKSK